MQYCSAECRPINQLVQLDRQLQITNPQQLLRQQAKMLAFFLFLFLLLAASAAATAKKCHDDDKVALLAVNSALGNPYHFASWTPDTPCCYWYHVGCDSSTGRVVALSVFQDASLTGAIPDAIANLTHLQTLVLNHLPALSGTIPDSFASLSNLSQLTISYTGVSGPVPSFLGELPELTMLDLSFNSLTGTIPALLLSKSPPDQQVNLWLSHNNLSGSIPAEFAAVNFTHIDLSRNAFTGDASALLGRGKALQYMDLSRNALSFNLSGVEFPEQLSFMDVSHNAIGGGIPAQVANLTNLQFFNVSYNKMCGAVPSGGNMARFDVYSFQHNKCLCGAPLAVCHQRPKLN